MTRHFLRATTAIALGFSLTAPTTILAANPALGASPGAFQVAQADNAGKNGKVKVRGKKDAEAELCPDGFEPSSSDEAKADEADDKAVTDEKTADEKTADEKTADEKTADEKTADETKCVEALGQLKKDEKAAEAAAEAPAAEQKTEEAAPAETAPAVTEAPEAAPGQTKGEDAASAAPESKRDKKKKKADDQAKEGGDSAAPAVVTETPEAQTEKKALKAGEPESEEPKSAEAPKPVVTEEPKSDEAEAAPESAPAATESADEPAVAGDDAATGERRRKKPTATASDADAAPVDVTSETVTEETTRTSDEEVSVVKSGDQKKDDNDNLIKILGAAAGGVVVGALLNEALGGGKVVESTGDRVIIERNGEYVVRKDENQILRRPGSDVRTETFRDGSSRTVVERQNGVRVVTIRDAEGYVVQRSRILPDGREILLFDDTRDTRDTRRVRIEEDQLPRYDSTTRRRHYVDYSSADSVALRDVLQTRPIAEFDQRYTLRQVRENERLRDVMPRLDLDVVSFDTGSAAISPAQARKLDALGWAMQDILRENPEEVFLIEGHTDAVGSRFSNLILSDRRAEAVALALTEYYDIPPENLITQGYGEEYLKVDTLSAERANRRAAVRRITPLLEQTVQR